LDQLLKTASKVSEVAFLKVLSAAQGQFVSLIQDVAYFDTTVIKGKGSVTQYVSRQIDAILGPLRNTLPKELSYLNSIAQGIFQDVNQYCQARKSTKKGGIFTRNRNSAPVTAPKIDRDQLLPLLRAHAKSIARLLRFLSIYPTEAAKAVTETDSCVINNVFQSWLLPYLNIAQEDASAAVATAPNDASLDVHALLLPVRVATGVVQMIQAHFETVVVPAVRIYAPALRAAVAVKNANIATAETKCAQITLHVVHACSLHVNALLSKQSKNDYRVRDDENANSPGVSGVTSTCDTVAGFVTRALSAVEDALDGANARVTSSSIAALAAHSFAGHLRRGPVSAMGALALARDVARYVQALSPAARPHSASEGLQIADRLQLLRDLASLFVVRPENLPSLLCEGSLARLDREVILSYLVNRADFKSAHVDHLVRDALGGGSGQDKSARNAAAVALAARSDDSFGDSPRSHLGLDPENKLTGSVFSLRGI
jgi:hypothetical protein